MAVEEFSTFKVPHELTGNLGIALKDQQTSPFHMKNKLCHLFILEHLSLTLSA